MTNIAFMFHLKQISKSKHDNELIIIFIQALIDDFPKTKLTLDDPKWVFYFCSNAGFDVFRSDRLLVYSRVLLEKAHFAWHFRNQPIRFDVF